MLGLVSSVQQGDSAIQTDVFFFFRFSAKHFLRPGEGAEPPGYVIGLSTVL